MSEQPLRFLPPETGTGPLLQIAPLVDVVFLLICFYLFVSRAIDAQVDPAVALPVIAADAGAAELPAEIVINLREDGGVWVQDRPTDLSDLRAYVAAESAAALRAGEPLRVVVRADRRQRFGKLDAVLAACRAAGVERIAFRALQEEP